MLSKKLIKAAAGAAGVEKDEYFNQTTLLLHGDGNQGANNFSNAGPPSYLAFSDNSSNDFPITVNGDAYGTPFSPYSLSDGYWSNYFDESNDRLNFPNTSVLQFEPNDFTIECWINPFNVSGSLDSIASRRAYGATEGWFFGLAGNLLRFGGNINGTWQISWLVGSIQIAANAWTHVAVTKSGTAVRLFVNGVLDNTGTLSTTSSIQSPASSKLLCVGDISYDTTQGAWPGYISNFRILSGTALYTSSFTPPTTPLTAITNTVALTCQSNRFKDNSTNNFAITANGNVAVKTLNPFNATIDGTTGSGYFDGTGDYLALPDSSISLGSGDCAIDFWCYITGEPTTNPFLFDNYGNSSARLYAYYDGTTMYLNADGVTRTTTFVYNQWNYFQFTRTSGTGGWYLNGNLISTTASSTGTINLQRMTIGAAEESGTLNPSQWTQGYISNFRASTTNRSTTVPTETPTSDANTSFLTCQYQGTVRNIGFIDSSPNNFPITRNGNTTQGSFSPFSNANGEWSNYFNGSSALTFSNSGLDIASGTQFTIECWINVNNLPPSAQYCLWSTYQSGTVGLLIYLLPNGSLQYFYAGNSSFTGSAGAITPNTWHHVAISGTSGTSIKAFVDGVQDGSTQVVTALNSGTSTQCGIGYFSYLGSTYTPCYISNFSINIGTAKYTSNFTPSITPLETGTTNQKILACYSNRFIDANTATTAKTLAIVGTPSIQPFSPFAPSAAYDPSVNGGSGYFDGSSDYLQSASNADFQFGTGEFVIEGWYYFTGASANYTPLFSNGTFSAGVMVRFGTNSDLYINGTQRTWTGTTGTFPFNSWNHVCLVRTSTTVSLYINGTRVLTATDSANISPTSAFTICDQTHSLGSGFTGYVSNFRTIKGNDGPYDATLTTITPPTAPLTAVSGTSLLCNFTNAGIYDSTAKNNLETVGNAQVDTSVVKYGTGSMKFDGTGDGLYRPTSPSFDFGGDFTVECWVYANALSSYSSVVHTGPQSGVNNWVLLFYQSKLYFGTYTALTNAPASTTLTTGQWTHVAVSRSGSTIKCFQDGVEVSSTTVTTSFTNTNGLYVGKDYTGGYIAWDGYIDDLRITKGVARYTSNFTVPDKAFPNQ